jgi:hypothetical protein
MKRLHKAFALAVIGVPVTAQAAEQANPTESPTTLQPVEPSVEEATRFIFGSRLIARDTGAAVELDARARFPGGIQLGVATTASALERAYITGQTAIGVAGVSGVGIFLAPLLTTAPLTLDLRVKSGVAGFYDVGANDQTALRQVNELGFFAHVSLDEDWLLRAGAVIGVELELGDAVLVADQSQLLDFAVGYALSDNVLAYVQTSGGGTFGFDGDNGKFLFEGSLGLRVPFGEGGAHVAF